MKRKKNLPKFIEPGSLDPKKFIKEKVVEIRKKVGKNTAVMAVSGGMDSAVAAAIGHIALGSRMEVFFVDTGLPEDKEAGKVFDFFSKEMDMSIEIIDRKSRFSGNLKEDRKNVSRIFYKEIFSSILWNRGVEYLIQGTSYDDIEETVSGAKWHRNVLSQVGINPKKEFGYRVLEPLARLRKESIRILAKEMNLPDEIVND